MSLRARIIMLVAASLLLSVLLGGFVAGYEARRALSAELAAAMRGAELTVDSSLEDLPQSDHPARDLRQLVATFDGNRHVSARLIQNDGRPERVSQTEAVDQPAPAWFVRLLGPPPRPIQVDLPPAATGYRAITLTPTAEIDVSVAWREFIEIVTVLMACAAIGLGLVFLVISAALRPLRTLAAQFARIGAGDYSGRVPERGPSELLGLQRGFNRMALELAATTERNRQLGDQLLTIQEEERADIARDLHDDIGPHLFAVNMDAQMIAQLSDAGRPDAIREQVRSIQAAVRHMQRQVREVLERLRPAPITELGLNAAIQDLVAFWTVRRPEIAFNLVLLEDESRIAAATKDVVYRVVQEAANNAVRHGDPAAIWIALEISEADVLRVSVTDNGAGRGASASGTGLGLIGMRERVSALGGCLSFGPNAGGAGWTTAATLALATPAETRLTAALNP
jgi:two-component system, NarL family, sensor histidine kinase UhpB